MGLENVADGGQAPLRLPAAPLTEFVPPLPATLAEPPEPEALALVPANPGAPLSPLEFGDPPAAPARMPAFPAALGEACPPTLLGAPALLARPAAPGASAEVPLPHAPFASSGDSTATRVRAFAENT